MAVVAGNVVDQVLRGDLHASLRDAGPSLASRCNREVACWLVPSACKLFRTGLARFPARCILGSTFVEGLAYPVVEFPLVGLMDGAGPYGLAQCVVAGSHLR